MHQIGQGMGAFERGDDALQLRQELEGLQGFLIGDGLVGHPPDLLEVAMLGAYAGIIQPGGDGMRRDDLAVIILQEIAHAAM